MRRQSTGSVHGCDTDLRAAGGPATRRGFLTVVGTGVAVAAAGCLGGDGEDLAEHPAGRKIEERPRLGPRPTDAAGTLVLFTDPACPRCASYYDGALSRVASELVGQEDVALVARPWAGTGVEYAETAVVALEATFDREESAFWGLLDHYFGTQGQWNADVLGATERWLDDNAGVDGAAVVADVADGAYDDVVAETEAIVDDAGISTHPTTVVFAGTEHQVTLDGAQSFDDLREALDV